MGHMQRLHLKISAIKSADHANDSAKGDLGGQQTGWTEEWTYIGAGKSSDIGKRRQMAGERSDDVLTNRMSRRRDGENLTAKRETTIMHITFKSYYAC